MQNSKLLAAAAYICWLPSLFIVLTDRRKDEFVGRHGCQALLLWTIIFLAFFAVRAFINFVWSVIYVPFLDSLEVIAASLMWGYAVTCGFRAAQGERFPVL
jgi:hypothetical protein